jgi:ABC-type methionine transport system ATPase subunit
MAAQNINPLTSVTTLGNSENIRLNKTNITMRVPTSYHQEPIISHLVSDHGVTVNITSALLGENAKQDGWFNLELQGSERQIQSAMIYLEELDLEVWERHARAEEDSW